MALMISTGEIAKLQLGLRRVFAAMRANEQTRTHIQNYMYCQV